MNLILNLKYLLVLFLLSPLTTAVAQPWRDLPLVDARSGETFTFAAFSGKTVFVEPMATWCANCRRQLINVRSVQESLEADRDDIIFVALSIETTLSPQDLAAYADREGFSWLFAVMTPEMLRELTATFGRAITSPPSTPHFVIRPDGGTSALATGMKSPEQILAALESAQ